MLNAEVRSFQTKAVIIPIPPDSAITVIGLKWNAFKRTREMASSTRLKIDKLPVANKAVRLSVIAAVAIMATTAGRSDDNTHSSALSPL